MKSCFLSAILFVALTVTNISHMSAKNPTPKIKEQIIAFTEAGINYKCFVAYDENIKGKRPAILVIPEWWGLNDYTRSRARQLATLGYIAMAVDMYGNGANAANPQEAQQLTKPFYSNPQLSKSRVESAIKLLKTFPMADGSKMAAIGYCFGGNVVLNAARLGTELKGVVSFHGGLGGAPADKALLKAKILVCNGGNDKFVSQESIDEFRHSMDSIGADYKFISYPNATHAFTNPAATETGKKFGMPIEYNAEADKASWNDMKGFLGKLFSEE